MTIWEFLTLTLEWLAAEYEAGGLDDAIQRARQTITLTEQRAGQWLAQAKSLAIVLIIVSLALFLAGIIIGGIAHTGWPNSLFGLLVAPLLFVMLVWWTPLVAIVAVVYELAHLRIKSAPGAAVAWAKWWLGFTCGVLLWQVIASLAFTFIPYWNAPSRIPVLIMLTMALALIGIRWGGLTGHRLVIKTIVVMMFVVQVMVCFVPSLAILATASSKRLNMNVKATAKKVERDGFLPALTSTATGTTTPSDTITLGSGVYNFKLGPGETNDKWIVVEKDHLFSFSSSTMADPALQPFFIISKGGKMIRIDREDVLIPDGLGPFKLMGGETGAYIKLLIVKQ